MVIIAVYGTLRKGGINNERFNLNLNYIAEYLGKTKITGFKLWDIQGLPYAEETLDDNDEIIVELYKINHTKTFWEINLMELTAGYFQDLTTIKIGKKEHDCLIYTNNMSRKYKRSKNN